MATPPTRLSRQARREQLLDAATAVVRVHGADGLSLPTLAEAAGVSRPVVYDHFGTRSGLLLALYRRLDERHQAATTRALEQASPTAVGVAGVISVAYFACATDMPELNAVSAALKGDPEMEAIQHEMYGGYIDSMAAALAPYSGLSRAALRLHCTGSLGAADAIAAELHRGTTTVDAAVTALTRVILATSEPVEGPKGLGVPGGPIASVERIQIAFHCTEPERVARFWCAVLGYVVPPAPGGISGRDRTLPPERQGSSFVCVDPAHVGPRLLFRRALAGEVVSNRLNICVRAGAGLLGEQRLTALEAECERLVALGATRVRLLPADGDNESCLVMQDVEGNEFCLG